MSDVAPRVSVVVAGGDDPAALQATVASLLAAPRASLEVVVVAGPGGDAVDALASTDDARLLVVPCDDMPVGARVNVGIALARAPFVKLVLRAGVRLLPDAVEREAALLTRLPRCSALFSERGEAPDPCDASALVAGLVERRAPCAATALLRAAALRALGGVDATLDSALAFDLWLRLLPGSEVAQVATQVVDASSRLQPADEGTLERAEHGFVLARAVHGDLERWVRALKHDGRDERAAWTGLAVRLVRSGLAEALPLAREACRVARRRGLAMPAEEEIERLARAAPATQDTAPRPLELADGADERAPEALPGVAQVRELSGAIVRAARARRALDAAHADLRRTTERLAYDVTLARRAAEDTVPLVSRVLDKLRVGRRIAALYRRAVAGWGSASTGERS